MKERQTIDIIRKRIVLVVAMVAVIGGAYVLNFLFLFSAASAVDQPRAEATAHWYFFYWAVVFGGMILTAVAFLLSTETALGIGWVTLGCAIVMPFLDDSWGDLGDTLFMLWPMAIGPACLIAVGWKLAGADLRSRRPGAGLLAAPFVIAGVAANWFLAGLMFAPLFLLGGTAAIAFARWPRFSWIGGIVAAAFAFHGIRAIPACDPYFGVAAPLLWFGIPAAIFLGLFPFVLRFIRRLPPAVDEAQRQPSEEVSDDVLEDPRRSTDVPTTDTVQDEVQDRPRERMLWSA
jgi:hypothetical protein